LTKGICGSVPEWKCGIKSALQYDTNGLDVSSRFLFDPPESLCKIARISICFESIIKGRLRFYMYVYLSSDGQVTQIASAATPEECGACKNADVLMVLQVPNHMVHDIVGKWKRESRGDISRVKKGFKLAKQYNFKAYVSDIPVGELETLKNYKPPSEGAPKKVPASFWENL